MDPQPIERSFNRHHHPSRELELWSRVFPQGSRLQPRQAVGTLHLALTAVDGADTTTVPTIDDRLHPRL